MIRSHALSHREQDACRFQAGDGGLRLSAVDNAGIVTSWLKSKPGNYYCQTCITENTGVKPPAQVNQIVRPLAEAREWRYMSTQCDGCRRTRKCIRFLG